MRGNCKNITCKFFPFGSLLPARPVGVKINDAASTKPSQNSSDNKMIIIKPDVKVLKISNVRKLFISVLHVIIYNALGLAIGVVLLPH